MTISAIPTPGGGHDIITDKYPMIDVQTGARTPLVLVRVRPVGTLEWGDLSGGFTPGWVPDLVEALELARRIGDRDEPWKPYIDEKALCDCGTCTAIAADRARRIGYGYATLTCHCGDSVVVPLLTGSGNDPRLEPPEGWVWTFANHDDPIIVLCPNH